MKLNSISGVAYKVADIKITAAFYESLGFRKGTQTDDTLLIFLNWFWIEFRQNEANKSNIGDAVTLYIKVNSALDYYTWAIDHGIKTDGPPVKRISGRTECIVYDPDGYRLAIFDKA